MQPTSLKPLWQAKISSIVVYSITSNCEFTTAYKLYASFTQFDELHAILQLRVVYEPKDSQEHKGIQYLAKASWSPYPHPDDGTFWFLRLTGVQRCPF